MGLNPASKRFAVLCVDSDAVAYRAVAAALCGSARLWSAHDFSAAVRAIRRRQYDLVVCDVTDLRTRGMEVLSILSSLYPSTPVIATSDRGRGGWTTDALDVLGAFAGMMKPFRATELESAVCAALREAHAKGHGDMPACCSGSDKTRAGARASTAVEVLEMVRPLAPRRGGGEEHRPEGKD